MPVAEHKAWCSILQIQQERAARGEKRHEPFSANTTEPTRSEP
jgi:hypothetical protein